MGKNSKRRNYTRYKYAADDMVEEIRRREPSIRFLGREKPTALLRKYALDWTGRRVVASEHTLKKAYEDAGVGWNGDDTYKDYLSLTLNNWHTMAQEVLFDLSSDSLHLFLTDPDLVDLLESSEYEDLRIEDLRFPANRIMAHFKRGTKFGGVEANSIMLAHFSDPNEVVDKLNALYPNTFTLQKLDMPPLNSYWVMSSSFPEWKGGASGGEGFYYYVVSDEGFVDALNKRTAWTGRHDARDKTAAELMKFIGGLGVYLKSYPEALRNGPPADAFDHDGEDTPSRVRSLNPMSPALAEAVRACRTGKGVAITPHMRRMHWRRVPDDVERYPNKHGLLIPVKACFIGKAKTVLDITEPAA